MFKKYLDAQMPIPTSGNYNDQKNIGGQNVEFRQNDLPALQEFEITAVVGATGMQNNVLLIPGPNPTFLSSKLSLFETTQTAGSAGLLLSSTVSANTADGWIELKDYITANSMW